MGTIQGQVLFETLRYINLPKENGIDVIVYSQQKWNKKGLRLKITRFIFFVVHKDKESICQNTTSLLSLNNLLYVFVERRGQSKGVFCGGTKMVIAFYRSLYFLGSRGLILLSRSLKICSSCTPAMSLVRWKICLVI